MISVTKHLKVGLKSKFSRMQYTTNAELIQALRHGDLPGANVDEVKRCEYCSRIYHETLSGKSLAELPPTCAIKELWIKKWMEHHESLFVYDQRSLDKSVNTDDDKLLEKVAEESVVFPTDPRDTKSIRCGLYCCQN
jgi:hypothetical protein